MYRRSTVYQCPLKFCDGHIGIRISGAKLGTIKCHLCGSQKKEIPRAQVTGDQIIAMLVGVQCFKSSTDQMCERYIVYFKGI